MPCMLGSDFLGVVSDRYPETIRIILTGHPNLDTALRAINKGHIYRFLIKPCSGMELGVAIRKGSSAKGTIQRESASFGRLSGARENIPRKPGKAKSRNR